MRGALALLAALAGGVLAGCETGLDPIDGAGRHFSFSGTLDANADTQWVRVEPVRTTLGGPEGPTGTEVTLERLSDGRTVRLAERVVAFRTGPAHLFWATEPVGLGEAYRLRASGPDGEASTTVETPGRAPDLTVFGGPRDDVATAVIRDVTRLVDIVAVYTFSSPGTPVGRLSQTGGVVLREDGSYSVGIYPARDRERLAAGALLAACEVVVAAGSDDWEGVLALGRESGALESLTGRVEGGVGFVGGVATARAPMEAGGCPPAPRP